MRCDARTDAGPRHRPNLPGLREDVLGLCVAPEVTPVRASGLLLSAFRKHLPEASTNENHLQPLSDSTAAHLVQHASALAAATSPTPIPSSYSMLCMNVVGSHTVPGGPGGGGGGYGPPPSFWANVKESPGDAPSGGCTALYSTAGRPSGPKKSCGRSRRSSVSVPPPTRSTSVVYAGVAAYLQSSIVCANACPPTFGVFQYGFVDFPRWHSAWNVPRGCRHTKQSSDTMPSLTYSANMFSLSSVYGPLQCGATASEVSVPLSSPLNMSVIDPSAANIGATFCDPWCPTEILPRRSTVGTHGP
eukprot:m.367791 g.367791  ORF g.367791 m.367791 type:complete len:303 (-) comp28106_c0_seq1:562-1470(-)